MSEKAAAWSEHIARPIVDGWNADAVYLGMNLGTEQSQRLAKIVKASAVAAASAAVVALMDAGVISDDDMTRYLDSWEPS
jgi:hypothetical protein